MRTVAIKWKSHDCNVWKNNKSKSKDEQCFQDWLDIVLKLLQIVTCSIRNPKAGIRKVSLTNDTQNKLKTRVSNKKHTVSRLVLLQHILENRYQLRSTKIFQQWQYINIFRKNKFSVERMFFPSILESILKHPQQKQKPTISAHFSNPK